MKVRSQQQHIGVRVRPALSYRNDVCRLEHRGMGHAGDRTLAGEELYRSGPEGTLAHALQYFPRDSWDNVLRCRHGRLAEPSLQHGGRRVIRPTNSPLDLLAI